MKFRPFTGRFCTELSVIVELTCDRPISMVGVPPETLTVSATPDTAICTRSVTVCPTFTVSSGSLRELKPDKSAVTSYTPTGSSSSRKRPFSSETVVRVRPVVDCTAVTVTPGITAPV